MGLVVSILMPVVGRVHSVIMDPLAFVQQPVRWLRLLSQYSGAFAAAPNFAYEYCVQRVRPEDREDLSLGTIAALVNGSEPIRPETLGRFQAFFAPAGLKKTAMRPSYGLAEATVFVSASPAGEEPTVTVFSRTEMARGTACVVEPTEEENVTRLVACGWPVNQDVAIVDPRTLRRVEDGCVGEIWVSGPNVGNGYWGRPEESQESFRAVMADDLFAESGWLRTGDLGVWHDKQLYITGRIKDLVIIDGTNHYPQDIEVTAQEAHPALRPDHCAAFAVPSDDGEKLVVVAEHSRSFANSESACTGVARAVRAAVSAVHAVALHDFVLVPPGTVPRTTSGKVARGACRDQYLAGLLERADSGLPGSGEEAR
jgi:acyl-CoA synthetase (AMP-forming)/AMP-acid ligase II